MKEAESEIRAMESQYYNTLKKLRIGYLLLYNLIQWSGFILIVVTLLKCLAGGMGKPPPPNKCSHAHLTLTLQLAHSSAFGVNIIVSPDGITTAYEKTSSMVMFCHALMQLEILHTAVGLVKANIASTFPQVTQAIVG